MKNPLHAPFSRGILLALALALPASAARLAYEGFDYTEADGTSISGLNGGTGWDEAFPTDTGMTLQPGLAFTGLSPIGKAMGFSPGADTAQGRDWGGVNPTTPPANGTYWFSVLVDSTGTAEGNFNWMFSTNSANGQNGVGFRTSRASGLLNFKPVNPGVDGSLETQAGTTSPGTPAFIVGRLILTGGSNSTFRIWVNPSTDPNVIPSDSDPNSAATTVSATNTANLRASIAGRAFGSPRTGLMLYDEIRIGNTFAEVLPPVAGVPDFTLDPNSGVEGQTLTFAWNNLPAGSNPTLNGNSVSIDGSGNGGTTLPAPASNTTYTLAWTGAGSPLTKEFTAVAPFFTLTPSSGYLGDNMTLSWRVPVSTLPEITSVTLTPDIGDVVDLTGDTSETNGAGTKSLPAPSATTVYTLEYTFNGNSFSLPTRTFTVLPPFLNVSPPQPITDYTDLKLTWRVPPEWDNNDTAPNTVFLRYGSPADFVANTYTEVNLTTYTNSATGIGDNIEPDGTTAPQIIPSDGQTEYRLIYNIGNVEQTPLVANVSLRPQIIDIVEVLNNKNPVEIDDFPLLDGVLAYSDRGHAWANIPSIIQGAQFIKLANDDKVTAAGDPPPHFNITFSAVVDSTFFLLLDNRVGDGNGTNPPTLGSAPENAMPWVLSSGFVDTGLDIGLDENAATEPGVNSFYSVYFLQVSAGQTFTFEQQNNGGARNMYGIAAVSPQIVPVSFAASPDTINEGQSTTLQWTVPVGATASIDQSVGAVSVDGVGVGSIPVNPTTTTTYTLTYVLGANPPVSLAPVTVTVIPAPVSGFGTYITGNFGGNTVPSGQQGPNDDPDGDGIDNLVEYAIAGGDPTRSTVSPAVISGTLVTFNKNTSATGITYALEKSSTLGNDWVPATPTTNDANVITYTLAPPTPSKDFVRLKVTQP